MFKSLNQNQNYYIVIVIISDIAHIDINYKFDMNHLKPFNS